MKVKNYRPMKEADSVIKKIRQAFVNENKYDELYVICGSVRRKCKMFGDIDIVTTTPLPEVLDRFRGVEGVEFVAVDATRKAMNIYIDGIQIDVYKADVANWGAMTLFLTGSAFLNIIMRAKAKKQGYKLNQYGLWLGDELLAGKTEQQIFDALGLKYLEPKERSLSMTDKGKKILVEV